MKRVLRISALIILFLLMTVNVDAVELCTKSRMNKLRTQANSVTLGYVFHDEDEVFENNGGPYFEIIVSNVPEGLEVRGKSFVFRKSKDKLTYSAYEWMPNGGTYEVKVYATLENVCGGELLATKKISIPKYNPYSRRDECMEYEEFEMCNKWYRGEIENEGVFIRELNKYIDSLKEDEIEIPKEKSLIDKIIDFYMNNKIITIPVTVIIIGGVLFVIVRKIVRRKKRVKIDF